MHRVALETAALQKRPGRTASEAQEAATALEDGNFNNGSVYEVIARLRLAEGSFPSAFDAIGRAKALRPTWIEYMTLEGDVYHAMKSLSAAVTAYRDVVNRATPGSAAWIGAKRRLALSLFEAGSLQEALSESRDLVAHASGDPVSLQLLELINGASQKK